MFFCTNKKKNVHEGDITLQQDFSSVAMHRFSLRHTQVRTYDSTVKVREKERERR